MNGPIQVTEISPTAAADMIRDAAAILLDVREDDEWAAGHSPAAMHRPLGGLDPMAIPGDLPVIAVCRSGGRSSQAAAALATAGRTVHNLTGGMKAWEAANLPVVDNNGGPGIVT